MSKQRHDTGWKKRHAEAAPRSEPINASRLARNLVDRGLANPVILGPMRYFHERPTL